MRRIVNVVGVGKKQTSKKGWDYIPVAFTFEPEAKKQIHGLQAATVNIGCDLLGDYIPGIGDSLDVVMHEFNFNLLVDAVL